ncbi:metal-dependent hydrolase [Brevibacillus panacihumi W25]|uniref:Metal-dependent hydrolase n=1 Tax=Brevibacillus panacihumi W25 TaxID=1408254 RepID=V6MDN6_9BACL|nr:metal-dependent hydrolase [Brevibacillus panacihumi W25]
MIRVISYNIHSGRDLFWRNRLVQMARTLLALDADVICLQEVHENSKYGYQAQYLSEQLSYTLVFSPSIALADGFYGNALLTRLPCKESGSILLPAKREKRTLLSATLLLQGREIRVWNTHCSLQAGSRAMQVQRLRSLAAEDLETPLLLFGDFNASNVSFAPDLLDCALEMGKEGMPTLPAFRRRLDYIFASSHWWIKRYSLSPVAWSDHVPVIAELELRPGRPAAPAK